MRLIDMALYCIRIRILFVCAAYCITFRPCALVRKMDPLPTMEWTGTWVSNWSTLPNPPGGSATAPTIPLAPHRRDLPQRGSNSPESPRRPTATRRAGAPLSLSSTWWPSAPLRERRRRAELRWKNRHHRSHFRHHQFDCPWLLVVDRTLGPLSAMNVRSHPLWHRDDDNLSSVRAFMIIATFLEFLIIHSFFIYLFLV